jgi:hypothetical protein
VRFFSVKLIVILVCYIFFGFKLPAFGCWMMYFFGIWTRFA